MRWRLLRGLRRSRRPRQNAAPERPDLSPEQELALALDKPTRHTWALVAAAEKPGSPEYARAVAALQQWPARRWLELDAVRLDEWAWYGGPVEPRGGWPATIRRADTTTLLLVLASTHRDGFLRERALEPLRGRLCPLASAALALRAVDHVAEVREAARHALDTRRAPSDAGVVVPILLAARQRTASEGALDRYAGALPKEALRSLVVARDNETRLFAIRHAPLSDGELVQIAASDHHSRIRAVAAHDALARDQACASELLRSRSAVVRAIALDAAPASHVGPLLDQLLLDGSAKVRRAAQARATTLAVDAAAVYRDRMPARAAVLGLGEVGDESDVAQIVPLAGSGDPSAIRRAAVRALGRLAPRPLLLELLPPLVEGDDPGVAREAGRQLRRIGFTLTGASLDRALASPHVWTRRTALGITLHRGGWGRGWDGQVAALALLRDEDEALRSYARSALGRGLATAGMPTVEQQERLRAGLARADLDPGLDAWIRFAGGL